MTPAEPELPHTDQLGRATLRTIAALAGVSASTVSRVLHPGTKNQGRATAARTEARIRETAERVGYVPNPHAASLRTQRSSLIGVLVPRLSDLVLATIYEGIDDAAGSAGYQTFVANTHDDPRAQRTRAEMFLSRHVDGLILGDSHADHQLADSLHARHVPFVLVNRHAGEYPAVTCDDVIGGRLAAEHLLQLGHTRVAVIAGEPYASTGIDRTAGFAEIYATAGHPVAAEDIVHSSFDVAGGRHAAEQLLRQSSPPTAIFAVNDFAAIGVLGVIRDYGLTPGTDIAVVGYNDVSVAANLPIPLTTIRSPMKEMGRRAVELLISLLAGNLVNSVRLPPVLVPRATTSPALGRTPWANRMPAEVK